MKQLDKLNILNYETISAIESLSYTDNILKKIEQQLQEIAEDKHWYVYLVNPDGERIRIQPNVKIERFAFVKFNDKNKEDYKCRLKEELV